MVEDPQQTPVQPPLPGDWLDSKTTAHQNNLEQSSSTFLPNGGHLLEPVPVLSSSSSSGGAGIRCRPGHWDSAAAVCLSTCLALVIASLLVSDDHLMPWTRSSR